jgi:hypothetical protein
MLVRLADYRRPPERLLFDGWELRKLLQRYSEGVARGLWRDYAIDHRDGRTAFAVFRRSSEVPALVIAKLRPGPRRRGYYVATGGRQRLAQGRTIDEVLSVFDQDEV